MRTLFLVSLLAAACSSTSTSIPPPAAKPVLRVFLLAGQSNMQGQAVVDLDDAHDYNGGKGNLVSLLADPIAGARWKKLRNVDGTWATRDDVFVSYKTEEVQKLGALSVGYAVYDDRHHFGPELGIGFELGDRFDEPVLLVKTAWGGKSLAVDFRPPSSGGTTGPCYTQMLAEFESALRDVTKSFPQFANYRPRVDGVLWFQGWNDGCDDAASAEYEENLVHLIHDVRAALGDPHLPFVVGETGNMDNAVLRGAQKAACSRVEVGGSARFVATASFLRKPEDSPNTSHGHHWFGNAESYLLVGDALGRAMIGLLDERERREQR